MSSGGEVLFYCDCGGCSFCTEAMAAMAGRGLTVERVGRPAEAESGSADVLVTGCDGGRRAAWLVESALAAGLPVVSVGPVEGLDLGDGGAGRDRIDAVGRETPPAEIASRVSLHVESRRLRAELAERGREFAGSNDRLRGLLELRDEVLAVASHDLKTPVTTLKLLADLMRSGALVEVNDKLAKHLDIMDSCLDKMQHLVGNVLDISRLYRGEMALDIGPVSLNSVVEDVVASLFPQAIEKSIALDMVLDGSVPAMQADAQRISQLATNLVDNGLKYTSRGGAVTVSTRSADGAVELEVRDTGCGIPSSEQATIFERFKTGSARPTGGESSTGLGLFICREIVEQHAGTIRVESAPGLGSIFMVSLPVRTAEEPETGPGGRDAG